MKKQNWLKKHEKAAAAGVCAAVLGITGLTGYHLQNVHAMTYAWAGEYEAAGNTQKETEAVDYMREVWSTIEYLEKYGITYDEASDTIYYDNQKVRWLIDDNKKGDSNRLYDEDGEIDVYVERSSSGRLIGIRVASPSEYEERSESSEGHRGNIEITVVEDDAGSSYEDMDVAVCQEASVEEGCTCLYITKENNDGVISFHIKTMNYDDMSDLYSRQHSGEKLP